MPKSHKRKNAGVGIDFKRAKHKVGRKLPAARNATDTTIKSGTLTLTQQSLAADRRGQTVTERNLTLKEVLGQCGHYSERVRREALEGLAQLANLDPVGLRRGAAPVLDALCARFADTDAGVRGALATAARESVLPALGPGALAPFLPRVMAATGAALTHMALGVRNDALRLLDVLAHAAPECLGPAFLPGLLRHYATLLGRPARGRTLAAGSQESLVATLTGLDSLLRKAFTNDGKVTALGACESSNATDSGLLGGCLDASPGAAVLAGAPVPGSNVAVSLGGSALGAARCDWAPRERAGFTSWMDGLESATTTTTGGTKQPEVDDPALASRALLASLLSCWTECEADALAPQPSPLAVRCCELVCRCATALLDLPGGRPAAALTPTTAPAPALLRRVSSALPLARPSVPMQKTEMDGVRDLNVAGAMFMLRLLPLVAAEHRRRGEEAGRGQHREGSKASEAAAPPALDWAPRLVAWAVGVLERDAVFSEQGAASVGVENRAPQPLLPAAAYSTVLRSMLPLLDLLPAGDRMSLAHAANALSRRASESSAAAAAAETLWLHALRDPGRAFYLPQHDGMALLGLDEVCAWIQTVPQALWKLGARQPERSLLLLQALLDAARCAPAGGPLHVTLCALRPQLLVLWGMVRRGGKKAQAKLHLGPLAELGPTAQALAADALAQLGPAADAMLRTTCWAALSDVYPADTAARLVGNLCVCGWEGGSGEHTPESQAMATELMATELVAPLLAWRDPQRVVQASVDVGRHSLVMKSLIQVLLALPQPLALLNKALEALDEHGMTESGDISTHSPPGQQPPPLQELGMLTVLAAVARRQRAEDLEALTAVSTSLCLRLVDGGLASPPTGWAPATEKEAERKAALAAMLSVTEALPGLLTALLTACAGTVENNLLPRLQLMLDLLSHTPLHAELLALRARVGVTLSTLRGTVEGLHAADARAQPAQEMLARCAVRAQLVLGG